MDKQLTKTVLINLLPGKFDLALMAKALDAWKNASFRP